MEPRTSADNNQGRYALIALILIGSLFQLAMALTLSPDVSAGRLVEPDDYMRIVRLRDVLAHHGWQGGMIGRDNAPYGFVLHWTMFYDLVILALYEPLRLFFTNADQALVFAAAISGPISYLALLGAVFWALSPLLPKWERLVAALLVAISFQPLSYSLFGRGEHHIAALAAWAMMLGFALRCLMYGRGRDALGYGIFFALTCWCAMECFIAVVVAIGLLGLFASYQGGKSLSAACWGNAIAAGLLIVITLIDPPDSTFVIDRLSWAYVAFAALVMTAHMVPLVLDRRQANARGRVAGFVLASLALGLAWVMQFPDVLSGPGSIAGPLVKRYFHDKVAELQPIGTLSTAIFFLGAGFMGLVSAGYFAWRSTQLHKRLAWLVIAMGLTALIMCGLRWIRFCGYPSVLGAMIAALAAEHYGRQQMRAKRLLNLSPHMLTLLVFVLGPIYLGLAASAIESMGSRKADALKNAHAEMSGAAVSCDIKSIRDAMMNTSFFGSPGQIILSEINDAPQILYWTQHRTVASPYHRNRAGLEDASQFFGAAPSQDQKAYAVAEKRGVHWVLICKTFVDVEKETALHRRLQNGNPPSWLVRTRWPEGTPPTEFILYRIKDYAPVAY